MHVCLMLKQTTGEPIISLGTMRRTSWTHGNMLTAAIYFWCRPGLLYLYIVLYSSSGILGGAHFPRLKSVVCIVVPVVEFNFFKLERVYVLGSPASLKIRME